MKEKVFVITGPTATGKTALAVALAGQTGGEVVSADSMQIYKEMDIGTAKPTRREQGGIRHHMMDIVYPDAAFSVAEYQGMAQDCIRDILKRGKTPIVAGGTGLYVNSLTYELDFTQTGRDAALRDQLEDFDNNVLYEMLQKADSGAAQRIHPNNRKRVIRALEIAQRGGQGMGAYDFNRASGAYDFRMIGLTCERSLLYERIDRRVDGMMEAGLLQEVEALYKKYGGNHNSMQAIGYKELIAYITGEISLEEAVMQVKQNTRRFAKRQLTWFRRDGRIQWSDTGQHPAAKELAEKILES